MVICYFTATGNSLYVAREIGGGDAKLLSIPELIKTKQLDIADDAIGIVCPVYAGDMPKMVHTFIKQASIKTDYLFFVYTYGMSETVARAHATLYAREAGLTVSYENAIKMIDNYLPGFDITKQKANVGKKKIDEHIAAIKKDIAARKTKVTSVNIFSKATMGVMGNMAKSIMKDTAAQDYIVNDNCIQCGICAKVCPANNIKVTDHVTFGNHCEVCYACLHNCPKNAIHLKNEKSAARFRNEHVALKDIIASNSH